jgi:BASS family bile acid:Na+ symporter
MAVIAGLAVGNYATHLKAFTIYFLAIAMTFSTTGIDSKALWPPKKIIGPLLIGALLNYLVFGTIILVLAWLLIPDKLLFLWICGNCCCSSRDCCNPLYLYFKR